MSGLHRATGVEALFPSGVVAFETFGACSLELLLPSEQACIARSVEKRAMQFAAGRICGRAALAELGIDATALLRDVSGAPLWPTGMTGSITHAQGYCVAAVARADELPAIGVDAEFIRDVDPSVWTLVMRAEELSKIEALEEARRRQMAAVTFCAKEAAFKCQYPLTRSWLGFEDAVVEVSGDALEVSVVAMSHPARQALNCLRGRFRVEAGLVVVAMTATYRTRSRSRLTSPN